MDSDDADRDSVIDIEKNEDVEEWLRNVWIGFVYFVLCVTIASIVSITIISTYRQVQRIAAIDDEIIPFRTVNHGIWSGYRHEFFNNRLSYRRAEQVCVSRDKATLLHFKSVEQEDAFDTYVSLNFWSATDYPEFQLWTSGMVMARRVEGKPNATVSWPEPAEELKIIHECAVRGEGIINAFAVYDNFWQERHIVKDYIMENQQESDTTRSQTGCWQHVKRNDWAPASFYRFVCLRRIE